MENSDDPLIVNGLLTLTLTTAMYRQRGSSSKHASITAMLSYNVVQTVQENENGFCRKSNLAFYISTWIYTVKILFLLFFVFVRHKHPRKRRKAAQQRSVNIALIINTFVILSRQGISISVRAKDKKVSIHHSISPSRLPF